MKKLPETLYVKYEDAGDGDFYLIANDKMENLVVDTDTVTIGQYILVDKKKAKFVVETFK